MRRRVAIAIPARDEADYIGPCLARLSQLPPDPRVDTICVVVLANNCADGTADRARACAAPPGGKLEVMVADLPPQHAHAGWARRLALDAAAEQLTEPADILISTDADTLVDHDWLERTVSHLDRGYDAVAGVARLDPRELRALPRAHRRRLAQLRRYERALNYLKAERQRTEPWPRHFFEGGASMAVTMATYRAIGGAPTPMIGEDRALFDAIRQAGGRLRHPMDVKVRTSARLAGRAPGGISDVLAWWGNQREDEPITAVSTIAASLGLAEAGNSSLTFRQLPTEIINARRLVEAARRNRALAEAS